MPKKNVRDHVIAFRLSAAEYAEACAALANRPMIGVASLGAYSRKATLDGVRGKYKYTTKKDALLDPEVNSVST